MTVPCFLLAGCLFMPGHAHTANAPHHRPAEHAGAHSTQRKSRRRTGKDAAPIVPLPRPRPKALEKAAEPAKDETAQPTLRDEEKPTEEKPAAPLPEPKPETDEPDKTEKTVEPEKPVESEEPKGEKAKEGTEAPKPEASGEKSSTDNSAEEDSGEEGEAPGDTASKDKYRDIPEMAPTPDPACTALKASGMAEFEELPPLSEGVCGTPNPIRTTAIRLADGTKVPLEPAPVTRCSVIAALATWMREDVEPTAREQLGSPITALRVAGSYVCRGRDGDSAAQLSEHGHANAVDISAFKTKPGQWKNVKDMGAGGNGFLAIVRGKACGRFTTVIGPGLDQYHSDHLHFDTKLRGRNGRSLFCQ